MRKKLTLSAVLCCLAALTYAQNPMTVLVEESTNASCGPCAAQNPAFDALMEENAETVIVLKYQWYFPGFDPMHNDNVDEANARTAYYGINGVPTAAIAGVLGDDSYCDGCGDWDIAGGGYEGGPYGHNQAVIDYASAIESPLVMTLSGEIVDGMLLVTGGIEALSAVTGDLRLRIAIGEAVIEWDAAPGSNGETEFNHVMKAFIGGTDGISLANMEMGDTYTIDESFDITSLNIYDFGQLELTAFVQNDDDKQVYQAVRDASIDITTEFANNAGAGAISGLPEQLCAGTQTIAPTVRLVNSGNETLVSADIEYSINGGSTQTTAWTGSLSTLGSEDVTLDDYTFEAGSSNTIEVTVTNPNGVADENATDDMSSADIALAPERNGAWTVEITTDQYAYETYWEVRSADGSTVVASGGNTNVGPDGGGAQSAGAGDPGAYANNSDVTAEVSIPNIGCYEFVIVDDWGDGMYATQWGAPSNGSYTVTDGDGNIVASGGGEDEFTDEISLSSVTSLVGLEDNVLNDAFNVFPNPTSDMFTVSYNLEGGEMVTMQLVNNIGQVVMTRAFVSNGQDQELFDVSDLQSGVYHLNTFVGDKHGAQRISIVR